VDGVSVAAVGVSRTVLHRDRAIQLAAQNGCRRVAFPAISTGVYSYPVERAARIAIASTSAALAEHPSVEEARFWLFSERAHGVFAAALAEHERAA